MAIDYKIINEKLQYSSNRAAEKISTLSSDQIHKYENLAGEKIFSSAS